MCEYGTCLYAQFCVSQQIHANVFTHIPTYRYTCEYVYACTYIYIYTHIMQAHVDLICWCHVNASQDVDHQVHKLPFRLDAWQREIGAARKDAAGMGPGFLAEGWRRLPRP